LLGKFPEAVREYQSALQIEPDAAIFSNLGTAYYYQGKFDEAASAYEESLKLGPGVYVRWANLGDALRQIPGRNDDSLGAYGRAAELLRDRIEAEPGDLSLASRAALYLAKAGKTADAVREMRALEKRGIDQPADLYRGALTYELAGERDHALRILESALTAGFSRDAVKKETELAGLRQDVRFHKMLLRLNAESP
jgi:tetratricopeptide (TPR) repeat protein